jgi:4-carboxymuconolactone decarboxylase
MDRYTKGINTMETLFSQESIEQMNNILSERFPDLAKHLAEVFGDIYTRPQLDLKTRELATIASLITLGNALPQLKLHLKAALRCGWTQQEILEIILQMSLYAGYPAILNALNIAIEVFDAEK